MAVVAELFSEGKSGSFFYFSNDGKYLIKTIPHRELLSLIRMLPQYVDHIQAQPFTLLVRSSSSEHQSFGSQPDPSLDMGSRVPRGAARAPHASG